MQRRPYSYGAMHDVSGYQEQWHGEHIPLSSQPYSSYPNQPYPNEWPMNDPYLHDLYQAPPYPIEPYHNPFQQLAKPNQPSQWSQSMSLNDQHQPFTLPQNQQPRPSFMSQFQGDDGQLDLNKMLSTVGHLANTVQQVTPVIQQVSSLMKSFKT